jgi:alpha-tubulin suppressor-like RCC1 family protein
MKKKITFAFLLLAMQINAQCWESISADVVHKVAIKSDGTLWAWGGNYSGSLIGTETPVNITSPTQIGTETNWQYVTTGYAYTLATKTDGTLWAWGGNRGQLGDGTTIMRINPVQIGTDVNWASVSAGYNHVLALKTDGTLWAWGMNAYGQLGDGTTIDKFVPIQIGTDTNWTLVSAGGVDTIDFSIALKIDGTLWAWGNNARSGQLGDGTTIDRNIPTQIGTDTNWQDAYAGGLHTIALKTDGTL